MFFSCFIVNWNLNSYNYIDCILVGFFLNFFFYKKLFYLKSGYLYFIFINKIFFENFNIIRIFIVAQKNQIQLLNIFLKLGIIRQHLRENFICWYCTYIFFCYVISIWSQKKNKKKLNMVLKFKLFFDL